MGERMEEAPDGTGLTERQAQRLEAQFNALYWSFLERKFRKMFRPEIDHCEVANRVCLRFAKTIRKDNDELLPFILEHGLGAVKRHRYFRNWLRWEKDIELRKFYRERPDLGFPEDPSEDGQPHQEQAKGSFVPLDEVHEPADDKQGIEDQIDESRTGNRSFNERIVTPLVNEGHISERDAAIFLDRLSWFLIPDEDKEDRKPRRPTFKEIGDRYGIGTTQVDRIVRKVMALLKDPDMKPLIQKALDQSPKAD